MRATPILITIALSLTSLAGCFGDAEQPEDPDRGATEATKAPAKAAPAAAPPEEPEPFVPVEVFNTTMHFDVQPASAASFDVPEGASSVRGTLDVLPRELCSTLQPDGDQEGPAIVFTGPGGSEKSVTFTKRAALCGTGDTALESLTVDLGGEPGSWSVLLVGVGNVDVEVALTAS
jgi:hypothetical protein